jgi:hypothetical protein
VRDGSARNDPRVRALSDMDPQTKREIFLIAIGTAMLEVPVVAIVALSEHARGGPLPCAFTATWTKTVPDTST